MVVALPNRLETKHPQSVALVAKAKQKCRQEGGERIFLAGAVPAG